jgi:hypothetical protein
MNRVGQFAFAASLLLIADPALAGTAQTPAPIAGVGLGAIALIGLGYRALKSRTHR